MENFKCYLINIYVMLGCSIYKKKKKKKKKKF